MDIYGGCFNRSCPGDSDHSCFGYIETNYHFYLSFENGYCVDYVTEKLYRTFHFSVIPIVLGGGNYSKLVPAHSCIDVKDFSSPAHLASYLNFLVQHPDHYLNYFMLKTDYEVGYHPTKNGFFSVDSVKF